MTELPTITDQILDQWWESALVDAAEGKAWSTNPLAILSAITCLWDAQKEIRRLREAIIDHRDNGNHWVHAIATDEKLWAVLDNTPLHQQVEGGCSCGWSGGGSWSEHLVGG